MSLLDTLPHRCSILGTKYVVGEYGASERSPFTRSTNVECWVQNASQTDTVTDAKRDDSYTHRVYFNADPGLVPGDEILVITGSYSGKTLVHKAATDRSAGLGKLWVSLCDEDTNKYRNVY